MIEIIKKFKVLLNHAQKKRLVYITFITIVGSIFEVVGVSLIIPLVSSMLNPNIINDNKYIKWACDLLNINNHKDFVLICIIAIIIVFIIKNLFILYEYRVQENFVYDNRFETEKELLNAVLSKPYEYFLNASTGEIMRLIRSDVIETYNLLNSIMTLCADIIVSIAIGALVLFIDPLMSLICVSMLIILIILIGKVVKPILKRKGDEARKQSATEYKWLLQSIQGIKEIKVAQKEKFFEDNFYEAGKKFIDSNKTYHLINIIPRLLVEAGCVCAMLMTMMVLILFGQDPVSLLPAVSAFAMAALKLMPIANRIISTTNSIAYNGPAIDKLLNNLNNLSNQKNDIQKEYNEEITINKEVKFLNLNYTYPNSDEVILEDASLTIPAGKSVGIVGKSGAGKTTVADIMLGLLKPQKGMILADDKDVTLAYKEWLDKIGYIPQSIFMMDDTIKANVAFGSNIDEKKVWEALDEAKLADYVRTLKDGIDTKIGERGIRLSGGQRQRVGIARALYNNPELLIFDEATSSLDNETEKAIMESINRLHGKKTMIIIAHRLDTIKECDIVYRVEDRKIIKER